MKYRDWFLSLWVILAGVAFVLASLAAMIPFTDEKSPVEELMAAGLYVYVLVVTICLISVALRVARKLSKINGMDK